MTRLDLQFTLQCHTPKFTPLGWGLATKKTNLEKSLQCSHMGHVAPLFEAFEEYKHNLEDFLHNDPPPPIIWGKVG